MTRIFLAALAALLLAGEVDAQSRPPPQERSQNRIEREESADERNDAPGDATSPESGEPDAKQDQPEQCARDPRHDDAIGWPTIVSAISAAITGLFTVVLGVAAVGLWRATERANQNAQRSAALAQEAIERTERAYLSVEIEKLSLSSTQTCEVVLRVANIGRTPAVRVVGRSWVDVRPWPNEIGASYVGPPDPRPEGESVVRAGQAIRIKTGSAHPLSDAHLAQIKEGVALRFYVFGSVTYTDAFEKERRTNFAFAVAGTPGERLDIAYASENNDAT